MFSVRMFLRNCTSSSFGAKQTIWLDWGQNCSGAKFRFAQKTCFCFELFYETAPSLVFGAKRTVWRVWGQNYFGQKLCSILSRKPLKSFFRKTCFRSEFFYKAAPHLFLRPNGLYGAIGGKIVLKRSFVLPKEHFFGPNVFTKPPPHLFFQAKRTIWRD